MLLGINHIGIAVRNLDEAVKNYGDALGLQVQGIHENPKLGTRIAFLSVGDSTLEFIQPTGTEGNTAQFLDSHGEGISHICFEVDDINKELESLSAKGIPLRDKEPREVIIGKIAFLGSGAMNGVTVELVEKSKAI